jgi:hypothetical protein
VTATAAELAAVWSAIAERPAPGDEMQAHPLSIQVPAGALEVGADGAGGLHLLIPVAAPEEVVEDRRSRGVQIRHLVLEFDGARRDFADVVCHSSHLTEVFERLVLDMVNQVAERPERPVHSAQVVLERWRELLEDNDPGFGPNRQAGLFAELWTLREILRLDPGRRLDVWSGPQGDRHDFRRGGYAIEVKATTVREGRFLKINGLLQLDAPPGVELFVHFMRLEESDSGDSVLDLLASLHEEKLATRSKLADVLDLIGFDPAKLEDPLSFVVLESQAYVVDDTFPRIVPSSFHGNTAPPGVLRLSYFVDLTGEVPAPIADTSSLWGALASEPA